MQALAQDQLRALLSVSHGLDDSLNIGIYDGDTSQEDRLWLQDNARLVFAFYYYFSLNRLDSLRLPSLLAFFNFHPVICS